MCSGSARERLLIDRDWRSQGRHVRAFQDAVRRRAVEREPVAYIIGSRGFRHLELAVDRRALIPRPETELLVEVGLALPAGASVLDVGTGSGAVALALARTSARTSTSRGSDLSASRARAGASNARRLGLDVRWLHADLLAGVPESSTRSSPTFPTSPSASARSLAPEILRHEPHEALFAGADGLSAIRAPARRSWPSARGVRFVALEVGAGQARAVSRAGCARRASAHVRSERDLAGIERVVVGERGAERESRAYR